MLRLVQADLLKLQRRRGMVAVVAGLVLASVALYYAVGAILDTSTDFESAVGILTLLAAVAGAIIGATAGGRTSSPACSATSSPRAATAARCSSRACRRPGC